MDVNETFEDVQLLTNFMAAASYINRSQWRFNTLQMHGSKKVVLNTNID